MTDVAVRLTTVLSDRYTVLREIGQGGMATVYLAEDVRHHRKVAIKVLHPELSAVLGGDRFLNEIELTANLQHPHILPLFDSGSAEGLLYYVMPFIEGETLRARLDRERQLPIPDAVRIAVDVGDALDYAHKRGVVHRDIKPENILLHDGRPLVADFGIALAVQQAGGQRMTQTGLSLGTPQYMSPEQATGEREIDARSDIYSLGAVTYEMLTGEAPFTGPTSQAIVAKVITTDPGSLVARRRSIPPHVEDAVLTALEKVPADRFASAAAFGAALSDPMTVTQRVTRTRQVPRATSRFDWRILAGTAAAALAIGGAAGWLGRRSPEVAREKVAFLFQTDTTHRLATACCSPVVAISPDGRRIVYGAASGAARVLMVRTLDDVTSRAVSGTEFGRNPSFSPDGQWILFEHGADATGSVRTLRKVPVAGGSALTLTKIAGALSGSAWLEDGTVIYSMMPPGARGLHRVSADGGVAERLTVPDSARGEGQHRQPSSVFGSDLVLFSIASKAGPIIASLSPRSGKITRIGPGSSPKWAQGFLLSGTRDGSVTAQRYQPGSAKPSGDVVTVLSGLPNRGAGAAVDFSVGRGGELVALTGHFEAALHITRRDATSRTLRTEVPNLNHFDNPRFSPDGRRIAVSVSAAGGNHQIYVLDPAAGTSERITFSGSVEHFAWTRDGRAIVYVKGASEIATRAADRSGGERIIWKGDSRPLAAITASDRWIAVMATTVTPEGSTSDILTLDRDSSVARPYMETPFNESAPTISPDGRWLAYVSDETGREEVYVASFPDASRGRQIVSTAGAAEPVWGSRGTNLYYRGADGRVVEGAYTTGDRFSITTRKDVGLEDAGISIDATDYDVTPAGDEFVTSHLGTVKARLTVLLGGLPRTDR